MGGGLRGGSGTGTDTSANLGSGIWNLHSIDSEHSLECTHLQGHTRVQKDHASLRFRIFERSVLEIFEAGESREM